MSNTSHDLILKNSLVYDAKNKINGENKDLLICDGKIVDSLKNEQSAEVIDASDCITFPGFIDLRSHVFAQETVYHHILSQSHKIHLDHFNVKEIERKSLNHGFTFLCEMDVPITQSKIALQNMQLSPLLDHAMIIDIGSNWSFLGDFESESAIENIGNKISLLLGMVKGLGISTNCPYHQQYWKLQEIPHNSKIPMIPLKSLQILNLIVKAVSKNGINTHFLSPYNKEDSSIDQMEILNGMEDSAFTLSATNQFFTKSHDEFVKFHATHNRFTCEITPFSLGNTFPLITRDRNLALRESKSSGIPVTTVDLEFDTEYYITGRKLEQNHPYLGNWSKLIQDLKSKSDLGRVVLSSNAPYHMSRSDWAMHIRKLVGTQSDIDLIDICSLLSANPARILDLGDRKGHLGAGADADIVCFNANPENLDDNSFVDTKFVVKGGHLVKSKSTFFEPKSPIGKIFWTNGKYDTTAMNKTKKRMENFYDKRFSMHLNALENQEIPQMEKL